MGGPPAYYGHGRIAELEVRPAALRAGLWLGWLSVAAVFAALALDLPARHRDTLFALTAAAALANGVVSAVPRGWWTEARRGEWMLTAWSAGLLSFTAALVLLAGAHANLDLLLFLVMPFLATVHAGVRRVAWLFAALLTFAVVMAGAPGPLPAGEIALRGAILAAGTMLALVLAELTRRGAIARAELRGRAELESVLLAEAHHRVKNSLQTVADLLLLGRPAGIAGKPFDETANRIRTIAVVHRLLAERRGARIDAAVLLEIITHGLAPAARIDAVAFDLDPICAQHLGIVANELIANAVEHGRPPLEVELRRDAELVLTVRDRGAGLNGARANLGLQLVERVVEQGLGGHFILRRGAQETTEAVVSFDPGQACAS